NHVFAYGETTPGSGKAPDGDTIFEIGSASKVFTTLLPADALPRGGGQLADPVQAHPPDDVKGPTRASKAITPGHPPRPTAGLPRLPPGFLAWVKESKSEGNPYARYTARELYADLPKCELSDEPGKTWAYSNLGAGLLGHVLERKTGKGYDR